MNDFMLWLSIRQTLLAALKTMMENIISGTGSQGSYWHLGFSIHSTAIIHSAQSASVTSNHGDAL